MTPELLAISMLVILVIMVINGVHLAFAMMFLAVMVGLIYKGPVIFYLFIQNIFGTMQNEVLIAVPLFVLMGAILEKSGAAEKLFGVTYQLLGKLRGGIAITAILISTLFAACTGVIAASVTTMALMALPAMLKRKYDKGIASGVVCAGGTLGILIPPSVMLVVFGPMAGLSVSKLFAGAIFPGLVLSTLYIAYIIIKCWRNPEVGPAISSEEKIENKTTLLLHTILYLFPVTFLLLAVIGSILLGVASPTEASSMGVVGAVLVALLYKNFNLKTLKNSILETLKVTSMVFYVIMGASMFTSMFLYLRGGVIIENLLLSLPLGKWFVLAVMMFIVFILGMIIDWIGILFIIVPVFIPIAIKLGFDPLWFGLLICVNLQMSFLTPPFAYSIFFLKGVAPPEVSTHDIYRGVIPFVILQMIGLIICILFPQVILWLPTVTLG
jgi:tripartite ATP-independent transporter DctM subunit